MDSSPVVDWLKPFQPCVVNAGRAVPERSGLGVDLNGLREAKEPTKLGLVYRT